MPKRCEYENCNKKPYFNLEGELAPRFCSEHKDIGMVNVKKQKQCEKCTKQPNFNFYGEHVPRFCNEHRDHGMVNVKKAKPKPCERCIKTPGYNVDGERARFCKQHAEPGMVNVRSMRCEKCSKQPSFNLPGERIGRFCKKHKEEGMVNIINKRCEQCDKLAVFKLPGERHFRACRTHKEPGMVGLFFMKRCEQCDKQPTFNLPGECGARFCATHAEPGMVDINHRRCDKCNKIPYFNVEGERLGRFCKHHREAGMINVVSKRCKTHLCSIFVGPRLRGYCSRCFMYTFPSDPLVRNHKTKEQAVVDFVKENYPDKSWVFDKTIDGGCSKRRPDIVLDLGSEVLIIEVDEWQHKSYDCICEHKRTMQLFDDLGSRPIILIRFNPDKYTTMSGTVVPSCWGITESTGICIVKPTQRNAWSARLEKLRRSIDMVFVEGAAGKTLHEICLFYDGDT
jgi:hypothetical protein